MKLFSIINILNLFTLINALSNTTISSLTKFSPVITEEVTEEVVVPVLTLESTTTTEQAIIEITNTGCTDTISDIVYLCMSSLILYKHFCSKKTD
jgi:hypothetical protein